MLLTLAACGGGGGGSDSSDGGGSNNGGPTSQLQADAGNDRDVVTGTTVTLDGSRSSAPAGVQLVYTWGLVSQPSGSSAGLSRVQTATPRFSADVDGDYVAELVVGAGTQQSTADRVTITATRGNTQPNANAGPDQNVKTGARVVLDGSASDDADGDTLGYAWSLTARPAASQAGLADADTRTPAFTADQPGRYVVSLTASDATVSSAPDAVVITAAQANSAPVANAGADASIATGDRVRLDGTASSDADGDALNYDWRIVSQPQGSAAALASPNSAKPSLTADALGDYVIELVVDDGQADSAPDRVVVNAGPVLALFVFNADVGDFLRVPNQVLTDVNVEPGTGDQTIQNVQVGRFIFQAVGRDYTIENVATQVISMPSGRTLDPNFQNFGNRVITMGNTVDFTTNASSVMGSGVYDFVFTFSVAETSEQYRFAYRLTVN